MSSTTWSQMTYQFVNTSMHNKLTPNQSFHWACSGKLLQAGEFKCYQYSNNYCTGRTGRPVWGGGYRSLAVAEWLLSGTNRSCDWIRLGTALGRWLTTRKPKFACCEWLLSICISRLVCVGNNHSDTMPEVIFCVQH